MQVYLHIPYTLSYCEAKAWECRSNTEFYERNNHTTSLETVMQYHTKLRTD